MKYYRAAALALLLPLLSACQATGLGVNGFGGGAAPPDPGPPPSASPMVNAVLARAPADPIAALPERIATPPVKGTWTAEFVGRLYGVIRATFGPGAAIGPTLIFYDLQLPAQLALAGRDADLAQMERELLEPADAYDRKNLRERREQPMARLCVKLDAGCSLAFNYRHELAIVLLARGNRAGAEQLLADIDAQNWAGRLFGSEQCARSGLFLCAGQAANRTAWRFQTGRIDEAVQAMEDWLRRSGDMDDATINNMAQNETALLIGRGRLREAARAIDTISANPRLRGIVVAPLLFALWDGAIIRGAGTNVQLALAALANRLPARYPRANNYWRHDFARALECRAAHVAIGAGIDATGTVAAFDRHWQAYRNVDEDPFSTGFCLHALAARVGRADAQPAIRDAMREIRAGRMRTIRSRTPEIAQIMANNGMTAVAQSLRAMASGHPALAADPQGYLLLDERAFEETLIAFLEATKGVEDTNLRRQSQTELMQLVMWRILAGAEG